MGLGCRRVEVIEAESQDLCRKRVGGQVIRGQNLLSTLTVSAHVGCWGRESGGLGVEDEWVELNRSGKVPRERDL